MLFMSFSNRGPRTFQGLLHMQDFRVPRIMQLEWVATLVNVCAHFEFATAVGIIRIIPTVEHPNIK